MSLPKLTDILVDKDELSKLYEDQAELMSILKTIMDSDLYKFMPPIDKGSLSDRIVLGIVRMIEHYDCQLEDLINRE